MCRMNIAGAAFADIDGVKAMTDVTGFGLLGHLVKCVRAQAFRRKLSTVIFLLPGVEEYIAQGRYPAVPNVTLPATDT